jgi:hypothetical protein
MMSLKTVCFTLFGCSVETEIHKQSSKIIPNLIEDQKVTRDESDE